MSRSKPHTVEEKVDAVYERMGVRKQIEAEIEAERASEHRETAEQLATDEATYVRQRDELAPKIEAAEEAEKAARKAAQDKLAEYLKVLQARDTIYDTFNNSRQRLEPKLRMLADPKIDAFVEELNERLGNNGKLYRCWPAGGGKKDFAGQPAMQDNRKEVDALAQAIIAARDEAQRLKLRHFENLEAEFQRIRDALPRVTMS
jgi:hypothetical protein